MNIKFLLILCFNRQKKTHRWGGLDGVFKMIGITKEECVVEITNLSSLASVKAVEVLVIDSNILNPDYL